MIRRLHVPFTKAEDVQAHLGDPVLHWRKGYSAQELAYCWQAAGTDFPPAIRATLQTAPEYANAELIDGFFEREVELDTNRANSQSDLMLVVGLKKELAVIAVEGKVDESFDKLVSEWNISPGRQARLEFLCRELSLETKLVGHLRYQLLHRAYSAISEAKRYRATHAMMMVHSFSSSCKWFEDFESFSRALDIPVARPGECSQACLLDGISFRLAWTSDIPIVR